MRIYISGPMTGYEDYNKESFNKAAEIIRNMGHEVINPMELNKQENLDEITWEEYLARDIAVMLTSKLDAVVLLHNWVLSRGARIECNIAKELGLKIFNFDEFMVG